ncbi:hypothetical protein [Actinomycetospora soli]|uniref:hypothetical protein n=1 Tax=Actinomycetospora soli TaxID=2893887 RepID=UPI001E2ED5E6|nr:hypothetical protein [Actinomycetospora soli]MCD2191695.1 hypothetical protein [Actinomycetospora soli]
MTAPAIPAATGVATPELAGGHRPPPHSGAAAGGHPRPGEVAGGAGGHRRLRWVCDRDDDRACVETLLALSHPTTGVLVVLAAPGAPWAVLAREVLLALGKDRAALAGLGRRRLADLAALWLRAERIEHLVVLRAHRLPPRTLHALNELAHALDLACWPVHHGPTDAPGHALSWHAAVELLRDRRRPDEGPFPPRASATTVSVEVPHPWMRDAFSDHCCLSAGRVWSSTVLVAKPPRW